MLSIEWVPRDEGKRTALLWAAERGNVEALQMLLENGANVDAKDEVRNYK